MELVFYTLASIALVIYLIEKGIELVVDAKELKAALRLKRLLNKKAIDSPYKLLDCPIHKVVMYYHSPTKRYACQNIDCRYSRGVKEADIVSDTMGNRE